MPVSEERRGERGLAISLSEKFYRRLLRAYPEDFKDRYGAEMALVFRDLCREELGRHGAWALAVLWARTLIETVFAVLEQRGGTLARQVSPGRWPTMPRRGGAAAIVGGLLMIFQLLGVLGSGYFLAADIQLLLMVGLLGFWALLARTEARSTTVGSRSVRPRQATVAAFLACCSAVSGVSVGTYRTWTGHAGPLSNLNETPFLVGTVGFAMLYVLFHRSGSPPATTDIENSSLRLVKVGVLLTGLATVMQLGLITYRASNSGYTVFFPEHLDPLGGPYYSYVLQNWVGWLWVAGLALIGVAVLQTRVFGKSGVFLLLVAVLGARLPLLSTPDISLSYAPIGVASVSQEWSPLLAYFMLAELPLGICWVLLGCALWSKATTVGVGLPPVRVRSTTTEAIQDTGSRTILRRRRGTETDYSFKEQELLESIRQHGEISATGVALKTSLSVAEAERMLMELARGGHLRVQARGGSLLYAFWKHRQE